MRWRYFFITIVSFLLIFGTGHARQDGKPLFRIRTITAGVNLKSMTDLDAIRSAINFLEEARSEFEAAGYEVQTLRVATQPFKMYAGHLTEKEATAGLEAIDAIAQAKNVMFSIGPVLTENEYDPGFADWAASLIAATHNISFSAVVASAEHGVHSEAARSAAEAIVAIANSSTGGEGNFRFTASANCPPNIPFFPAAYHAGESNFAIGLESPGLLFAAFKQADNIEAAKESLTELLLASLTPVQDLAEKFARREGRHYSGIDVSPAPGLDASIGAAIETLTRVPFGEASTLRACAAITDVLKNLPIKRCGYSGLMLPVIEDRVLAQRATEGRFTVQELLLYSSVSGTGLDVVPLPGDTPAEKVTALIADVAALSVKLSNKALSARLFLIPGKQAGEMVTFENPYLTACTVMALQ